VRVIADHLRDHEYRWSAYDFDFRAAYLEEREEISRGIAAGLSARTIAGRISLQLSHHLVVPTRKAITPNGNRARLRRRGAFWCGRHRMIAGFPLPQRLSYVAATIGQKPGKHRESCVTPSAT